MISLSEARQTISSVVRPLAPITVQLPEASGRILREAVIATEDFPAFDRSAMDGYAIGAGDSSERFEIIGEVQPGAAPAFSVGKGQCARIFTGAQIPDGAGHVIMQEDVQKVGNWMIPSRRSDATHIRRKGEDVRSGSRLLEPGTRIGPGEASLLAQIGHVNPLVSPAPRVVHLVTGNELVAPSQVPQAGQIRDSNSTLIASLLLECGAKLVTQDRCGDCLETLVERVREEPEDSWTLLLISGGASVGDYDFGLRALTELGFEAHFQHIRVRPGKPLVFASRGKQLAFVIPGNPVSHFVVFHVAIRLALELLAAAKPAWPLADLTLDGTLPDRKDPRETYWPARIILSDGAMAVRPLTWQSSGDLCGLVGANALIQIASDTSAPSQGSRVKSLLLSGIG